MQRWFRVHSFTGVVTGLMLFVICWSGTFTVLGHELDWLMTPSLRVSEPHSTVDWASIKQSVDRQYPEANIRSLNRPEHPYAAAVVRLDRTNQSNLRVAVHPGNGQIQGELSGFSLHKFFRKLHVQLFYLGGKGSYIGYYIVMSFAFVLIISAASALCFYSQWWKKFFEFVTGGLRQFWSSFHKTAGLWSLWFLVLIAITGSWYFFEITRLGFGDGIYVYAGRGDFASKRVESPKMNGERESIETILDTVRKRRPDLRVATVQMPVRDGSMYVMGQSDEWFIRDWGNRVYLNAYTGDVLYDVDADDLSLYWYWSNMADPLHFGNFAGLYSKIVWFLFGLLLCGLILTGTYLHVRRLAKSQGSAGRHRWPGTKLAVAVTWILLGATGIYGYWFVKSFGPTRAGVRHFPSIPLGTAVTIFAWTFLTILILAVWSYYLLNPRALDSKT